MSVSTIKTSTPRILTESLSIPKNYYVAPYTHYLAKNINVPTGWKIISVCALGRSSEPIPSAFFKDSTEIKVCAFGTDDTNVSAIAYITIAPQ